MAETRSRRVFFLRLPRCSPKALVAGLLLGFAIGVPGPPAALAQAVSPAAPAAAAALPSRPGGPSLDTMKALEQQVQTVLGEARQQQAMLAQLREQLAAAESGNAWLPWLLLGLVTTSALAVWLALRVRRLKLELAQARWVLTGDELPASQVGAMADLRGAPLLSPEPALLSPRIDATPGGVPTSPDMAIAGGATPDAAAAAAAAAPGAAALHGSELSFGTGVPPRPVSVEELLDLDQQVDFFLALGQTQSAIDLLLGHVRSTGGTYALPYLKLLEIYRLQGDDEAYERTRERFNQRFNALAPDGAGDLAGGRVLEDYPAVVQRLQRAWAHPLRAAAELESLLLRRADLEPFDLPAYREILMLHALVRDLPAGALQAATITVPKAALGEASPLRAPAREPPDGGVDLLLPLGDDGARSGAPLHLSERASAQAMLAEWVFSRAVQPSRPIDATQAPMPLDLDLSEFAPAPREFTRPAAFTDIDQRHDGRLSELGGRGDAGRGNPPPSRY
ncbi:MAG: hypothetical protein JNL87_04280 [Burkholderiaceae bacterium]|nr:hypothetical protein [Burkholderiaceae bacterium]